ncbi:hypothetical protein Ade02nite_85180 [Paractinoplanes deccanensis]|uniref:Uncharacterized protein n=1 Tax=Paractinoplanes deccanensis TaxID=113561 RepID=A0ABQ3YIT1_9ACTN|nr:hypothetical protein [Actinoplanes deccanensis]GID79877.1 hypothetical protein Ade02nite_85180 [Actinoplanes deccanensis]
MTSLSDAERDACDVMQALAGLAALLRRSAADIPGLDADDPAAEDARHLLVSLAEDGSQAASRVVAYLRELRGPGDGDLTPTPPRLGPWREWVPPRGHLFGFTPTTGRAPNEVPQPRRSDPGE